MTFEEFENYWIYSSNFDDFNLVQDDGIYRVFEIGGNYYYFQKDQLMRIDEGEFLFNEI